MVDWCVCSRIENTQPLLLLPIFSISDVIVTRTHYIIHMLVLVCYDFTQLDHASQQSAKYSTFQSPIKPTASPSCYFFMEMCNIPFNRVIVDPKTGSSRGFGFVTFGNAPDRNAALITMNGAMCLGNPIRVAPAIGKKGTTDRGSSTTLSPTAAFKVVGGAEAEMHTIRTAGADRGREAGSRGGGGSSPPPSVGCTIFVGGLNYSVTEEMLWNRFSPFGSVDYVKVSDLHSHLSSRSRPTTCVCTYIYKYIGSSWKRLWVCGFLVSNRC